MGRVDGPPVIAIDGPSGSGKGTVAYRIAKRLGFHLLDSGALYRLVALVALERGVGLDDETSLAGVAASLNAEFLEGGPQLPVRPLLDGRDVGDAIRAPRCGEAASQVAAFPAVRAALLERQRAFRRAPGLVADGRDMGTAVFPHAEVKIFLTASAEERARRRHKQLIAKGMGVSLGNLLEEIQARDRRDSERTASPLRPADGAAIVDTSGRDIETVVGIVSDIISEKLRPGGTRFEPD